MYRRYTAMLIAIDHGNKQIKTVHTQPFTSGLIQGDTPGFGTDCLAYQGKYYTLTDQRIPYRRDKTEDERFFILTLFAIAYEIEAMGRYSDTLMRIQLAVGLPPAHFGVQAKRFINYFDGRGAISFQFRGKPYAVYIENCLSIMQGQPCSRNAIFCVVLDEYHFRYMRSFWLKAVSIRIVWNGICLALEYLR